MSKTIVQQDMFEISSDRSGAHRQGRICSAAAQCHRAFWCFELSFCQSRPGQAHHASFSIYTATEDVTPRRGLSSSVFISAQSYGAILLLLGIISGWPSASCCKAPVTPTLCLVMQIKLFPNATCVQELCDLLSPNLYQKKRQKRNSMMIVAIPAIGPYCFSSNSQLIRTAARLYLAESSRKRLLMSPILSRLSPR
jgi:hypothetical protein